MYVCMYGTLCTNFFLKNVWVAFVDVMCGLIQFHSVSSNVLKISTLSH